MIGMTFNEFKETLVEGWEVDFSVDGKDYHYQRSGENGMFTVYLTNDSEMLYEAKTADMDSVLESIMSLEIADGKTISQLEAVVTVVSSS